MSVGPLPPTRAKVIRRELDHELDLSTTVLTREDQVHNRMPVLWKILREDAVYDGRRGGGETGNG